jgi:hypothetical protein
LGEHAREPIFMSGPNPVFVESGRRGALKRWKGGRIARLDDLNPAMKAIVLSLIAAAKEEPVASEVPTGSETGSTRDADRQS